MYIGLSSFCYYYTTPSKVAKQATKATPKRSAASTHSATSSLNEQDIRTLWSSFRNNGGTKNPNFEALGKDIGVSVAAAKWRFYKLKAIFEGESESPKHAKTATLQKKGKEGSKRRLSEDSDDESEASLALVSDGDSSQKAETRIGTEMKDGVTEGSDIEVKKEPGLNVKAESGLFPMEDYDV
ncbi:unnamed protein product [Penicillium pancosmium]